ncbi:hypothetical protein, partial [Roseburia intestinalis]|uniref:hypothetical protein n=1 Tax=Roseburia intestinalis TaxID=166486 RepID=UPI001A9A84AB
KSAPSCIYYRLYDLKKSVQLIVTYPANKKPRSRVQAPLLKKWQALDRAFSFLFMADKRKKDSYIV